MTAHIERLDSCSTDDLARACARRASQRGASSSPDPCYELFCRAFATPPDDDAWQAILRQYERLVRHWLGQHADQDAVYDVFASLWQALKNAELAFAARFPNIGSVMGYLKWCAITTRIDTWRKQEQQRILQEKLRDAALVESILERARSDRGGADSHLRQEVLSRLNSEQERVVFELSYHFGLTPLEIQAERPDLFEDARTVSRIKENLLKRLRRDQELRATFDH